jgi:hypothetical protein
LTLITWCALPPLNTPPPCSAWWMVRTRPSDDRLRPRPLAAESKSPKLYVAKPANHGALYEDCTVMIGKRIAGRRDRTEIPGASAVWLLNTRAAASRSTCSGRPGNRPAGQRMPSTRASRPIAAGLNERLFELDG